MKSHFLECDFEQTFDACGTPIIRCKVCGVERHIELLGLHRMCNGTPAQQAAHAAEQNQQAQSAATRLGIFWTEAQHYAAALAHWTAAGFPERSQVEVRRIARELCQPCESYTNGHCKICGCTADENTPAIKNKIKMASEHCDKGKW